MSSFNLVRVAPGLRVETCDNDIRPYIWNLNGFEALLTPPGDLFSHSGKGRGFLESVLSTPLRHTSISQVRCLNFFFARSHAPEAGTQWNQRDAVSLCLLGTNQALDIQGERQELLLLPGAALQGHWISPDATPYAPQKCRSLYFPHFQEESGEGRLQGCSVQDMHLE